MTARCGGRIEVEELDLAGQTNVEIQVGDSISNSFSLDQGAQLTVNQSLDLAGDAEVIDGTLNLNQQLVTNELSLHENAVLNLGSSGAIDVGTLGRQISCESPSF